MSQLDKNTLYTRDRLQFEIKSDFMPDPTQKESIYTQEFYFFIPSALQVNPESYTRKHFYRDQVNLIRFKTPIFSLSEIADPELDHSPLSKLEALSQKELTRQTSDKMIRELKLLANVVRSCVRSRVQQISASLENGRTDEVQSETKRFAEDLQTVLKRVSDVCAKIENQWSSEEIQGNIEYIDHFITQSTRQFCLQLLERIRENNLKEADKVLTQYLREKLPSIAEETDGESIIYHKSLLNKYVLDALLLSINRFKPAHRYSPYIGSLAAGVAMLLYVSLFFVFGRVWVINSEPFLLATVVLYIAKDRLKEWVKSIASHERLGWFSDYTTEIRSPSEEHVLGKITEKFQFIEQGDVPRDIELIRNQEFHSVVESFTRPETLLYYKKTTHIYEKPPGIDERRYMLNVLFRMNIHKFLVKASNPRTNFLFLDEETGEIRSDDLPKVYHLNLIMKNTLYDQVDKKSTELKKFRVVADKNGIKRIEYL